MSKLDALWAYQEAEIKKSQVEAAIRATPARQQFNKLHKLLKTQQATIQKLSDEMELREQQLKKLLEQADKLADQLDMEQSELSTMQQDDESTAEEMTELRVDVERLSKEINAAARDTKGLLTELNKASDEYQQTRNVAGKAKKEYDQLRLVCEKERDDAGDQLAACDAELAQLKQAVDPELMTRYEKVKLHNPIPIAKVINCKCSGCNMSLPMAMLKKLAAPDAVIECENCGRILYPDIPET